MSSTDKSANNPLNDTKPMPFDYNTVKNWPFETLRESYSRADTIAYAKGIGVGMPGSCQGLEDQFLSGKSDLLALPMMTIVLNQGPMWTQDPRTGIEWTKTVHAEESITMHNALPNGYSGGRVLGGRDLR